jgi:hypothetical protein
MKPGVEIEVINGLDDILSRFDELVKDGVPDLVRRHARLLCVQLAHRTQPFSVGEKGKGKAYNQSERRVDWDVKMIIRGNDQLMKIAEGLSSEKLRDRMETLIQSGNMEAVAKILESTGLVVKKGNRPNLIKGTAKYKAAHRKGRNKRTGRAYKSQHVFNMAANQNQLTSYIKKAQKRIGYAKAGWADCARKINAINGDGARGIPAWAKSKKGGSGRVVDMTRNSKNPSVSMTNEVGYVSRILPDREIAHSKNWTSEQFVKSLKKAFRHAVNNQENIDQPI